jgi:hypothetical protein
MPYISICHKSHVEALFESELMIYVQKHPKKNRSVFANQVVNRLDKCNIVLTRRNLQAFSYRADISSGII